MPQFRKKPVVIEAMQFTGENGEAIYEWANPSLDAATAPVTIDPPVLTIWTLEGNMEASVGDWIIKGVKGEFYPCKPDIFEATYEPADESLPRDAFRSEITEGPHGTELSITVILPPNSKAQAREIVTDVSDIVQRITKENNARQPHQFTAHYIQEPCEVCGMLEDRGAHV